MACKLIIALLFLYFVNVAVALQCYQCASLQDTDCVDNPKQEKFIHECNRFNEDALSPSTSLIQTALKDYTDYIAKQSDDSNRLMRCITIDARYNDWKVDNLERDCLPENTLTCEQLKEMANKKNVTIKNCQICNSNLCNTA